LFHPNPLFIEEFGEGRLSNEFEPLFKRLGPEDKKILFFLANLYEAAPSALIEKWMRSPFIFQHLHRLKSLGILSGGGSEPCQIAWTGFKAFLLEQMGSEEIQKLNDQLLSASNNPDLEAFFSSESRFFHQAHGGDPLLSAEGWAFFGDWAARRGLSQSAYEYYTRAHDRLSRDRTERRFELAVDRGKCLISAGRLNEAKSFFESLLKSYASHRESKPEFFSKIHERLGLIEMKRGNLKKARQRFEEALSLLENRNDLLPQSLGIKNFLASLNLLEGNYAEAIRGFRENYERAQRDLPWDRRRILTNNDLGEALLQNGQEREAITHWEECVEDLKKREDQNPLVRCYYQLSLAYQKIGEEEKGYRYLLEALAALRDLQNPELELRIYNALANLRKKRDPEKALECYEKALACAFHIQDAYSTAVILLNMGFLEAEQGHWEKVKHCLNQGIAYLEGAHGQEAQLHLLHQAGELGLARACLALAQAPEALAHAKTAMALVEKNPEVSAEKFETLLILRAALEFSGKHSEAERCERLLEKIAETPEEKQKLKELA
jgi:tetratricopeptide (TPR) repeat protein